MMGTVLVVVAFCATVYCLVAGVSAMANDSAAGSEHWMARRVALQALAVVLMLVVSAM